MTDKDIELAKPFKREARYQVLKAKTGRYITDCVVVEADWPEYEIVWRMIQDRMEGRPCSYTQAIRKDEAAKYQARVRELEEALPNIREELRACQAVIHLAGGFDPLYVKGAQAQMKVIDALLSTTPDAALQRAQLAALNKGE